MDYQLDNPMPQQIKSSKERVQKLKEALSESEKRFRAIFNDAAIGITLADIEGHPLEVNSAFQKMVGYSRRELRKMFFTNFTHPEDVDLDLKEYEEMKAGLRESFNAEKRYLRKDGRPIWVNLTVSLVRDEEGEPKFTVGVVRDITEHKRVDEALGESEKRFRQFFEHNPVYCYLVSLDGLIINVNRTALKTSGYKKEELLGKPLEIIYAPEYLSSAYQLSLTWKRKGGGPEKELVILTKDGRRRTVIVNAAPVKDKRGKTAFLILTQDDITDRKRAEENLRLYSKAVEEAPDGVQVVDLEGKVLYSNKAVERIHGFAPEELLGKDVSELNVDLGVAKKVILPSVRAYGSWSGELLVKHKDRRTITVWLKAAMVKDNKGAPLAMVGIMRDVTDQRELEKHKDDFISVATHELKTPLTSIKLFSQILRKKVAFFPDGQLASLSSQIDSQADKLINLVRNLLDATKLESGKITFKRDSFSLDNLLKEVVKDIQVIDGQRRIIIESKKGKIIKGDRYRLHQVLTNLLTNAVKHSPESGKIIIKVLPSKDEVLVGVQDFGEGIPKYKQAHLFERFYQAHSSSEGKEHFFGTGLGLYISSEIIKSHGGRIWLESEPGKGSIFYFTLPTRQVRKERLAS